MFTIAHNHSYSINKHIFLSPLEIEEIPIIDPKVLGPKRHASDHHIFVFINVFVSVRRDIRGEWNHFVDCPTLKGLV